MNEKHESKEHTAFLQFFYTCIMLAEINGGKYEDDVIKVDTRHQLRSVQSGPHEVEIERKANHNPVVYSKSLSHTETYRTHGEWMYLATHVANLAKTKLAALTELGKDYDDYISGRAK